MSRPFTIAGAGGKKAGAGGASSTGGGVESPNSLRSKQVARVIDLISEGPIFGLVDATKSVFFDGVQVVNDDGTLNFRDFSIQLIRGEQQQPLLSGFSSAQTETAVGLQMKKAVPIVRTIINENANRCRVTVSVPALQYTDKNTGNIVGTAVAFTIECQANGAGYRMIHTETIDGKTNTRYQRAIEFNLLAGGPPWDIRLTRYTPDSAVVELQNDLYWDSYTEIVDARLMYSNSACIATVISAEQFGSIPKRAYDVFGLQIKIPVNYDPWTRVYTGAWNGNFKFTWSNNPAWVFFDLVTNDRYGIGEFIAEAEVDKWALYEIARWCDQRIPNGRGGFEPRYTCNAVINSQREAFDVLQDLASVFRGYVYWSGGAMVAVADRPSDVVGVYNNSNVIDGLFTYQGAEIRARHTVATVTWSDQDNLGEPRLQWVEDPDAVSRFGIQQLDTAGFGITNQAQAVRAGRWALYTEQNESELVVFKTGIEGAYSRPGDVIAISDITISGDKMGGRLLAVSRIPDPTGDLVQATLDRQISFTAGFSYTVSVLSGDLVVTSRISVAASGDSDTIVFRMATLPPVGAPFVITAANLLEPSLWRVLNVEEQSGSTYEVTALATNPSKYDYIERNLPLDDADISSIKVLPDAVLNLTIAEYLRPISLISIQTGVVLSWTSIEPQFEIQWRPRNGNWTVVRQQDTTIDIPVSEGVYEFKVAAVNSLGRRGPFVSLTYQVVGRLRPPNAPQNFRRSVINGVAMFSWDASTDIDVLIGGTFELRFSPRTDASVNWDSAQPVITDIPGNATSVEAAARGGTWFLRTKDIAGIYSTTYARILSIDMDEGFRPFARWCESPGWLGSKINTEVKLPQQWLVISTGVGGLWDDQADPIDLWTAPAVDLLPGGGSSDPSRPNFGQYYFDNVVDLGAPFTIRLTSDLLASSYFPGTAFVDERPGLVDSWQAWDDVTSSGGGRVDIYIRATDDDPASPSATWRDWRLFSAGEYAGRGFEFRADLSAPAYENVQIETLCIIADLRSRIDQAEDVTYPGAKQHIDFSISFMLTPALQITIQDEQPGDNILVTNKTTAGFDLEIRTAAGAQATGRVYDWTATGY